LDFAFWALTLVREPYIVDHLRAGARDWKSFGGLTVIGGEGTEIGKKKSPAAQNKNVLRFADSSKL
jgi:hypothetical protein